MAEEREWAAHFAHPGDAGTHACSLLDERTCPVPGSRQHACVPYHNKGMKVPVGPIVMARAITENLFAS